MGTIRTAEPGAGDPSPAGALLALYDDALPEVYGYLVHRCGDRGTAEDLAAETFLAAAAAVRMPGAVAPTVPWLIGVARHKLADHWRGRAREQRTLQALPAEPAADDPWDVRLDALVAHRVLAELAPQFRLALTLRYLDDLPVAQVAELLGRTVHATEAVLVRARRAFRDRYIALQAPRPGREEDGRDRPVR